MKIEVGDAIEFVPEPITRSTNAAVGVVTKRITAGQFEMDTDDIVQFPDAIYKVMGHDDDLMPVALFITADRAAAQRFFDECNSDMEIAGNDFELSNQFWAKWGFDKDFIWDLIIRETKLKTINDIPSGDILNKLKDSGGNAE